MSSERLLSDARTGLASAGSMLADLVTAEQHEQQNHRATHVLAALSRSNADTQQLNGGGSAARRQRTHTVADPQTLTETSASQAAAAAAAAAAQSAGASGAASAGVMFPNLADLPRNWHIKKYKNGISYCGELRDKVWHGYGRLRLADDEIYEGEWENGKRCGIGVYTYHDRTIYYGQWRSNVKEGFGVLVRSDGHVYEGTWRDNKPDGFGRYTYANGDVYVGDMLDGMQNGSGLYISVDGSRYLGAWRDGRRQGEGLCRLPDGSFYAGGWDDDAMTAGSLRLPNGRVQQVMWDSDAGEWRIVGEQRDRSTASAAIIFSDSVLDKIRMEASGGLSTEDPQQSEDTGSPRNSNMRSPEVAQLRAHHPQLFVRRSRLDVLRALAVRLPRHVVVAARGDDSGERSAGGSGREPAIPVIPTSATGMLAATEGIMSPQARQQSQWLKGQLTSAFQAGTRWRQRDSEMDSLHPLASPAYLAKQLLIRLRTEMRREDEARGTEGADVLQNGSHYEAEMRYVCLVSECLQLFFQMLADRVLRATDNAAAVYVLQSLSRRLAKASEREANSAETASYLSNIVKQQHQALTAIVSRLNETAHAEQDVVPISATGIVEETSVRAVLRRIDKLSARPGREREHDALLRDLAPVQPTADVHLRLQRLLAENAKLVSVNDSLRARIVDLELAVTTAPVEPRDVHPGGGGVGAPDSGHGAVGAASMADSAGAPVPSVQPMHAPAVGDTGASLVQAAELQRLQRQVKALSGALENLELQSESRLQGKDEEIAELRKQLRRAIGERDSANAKCEEHAALAVRLTQENNALRDQCVQLQEAARGGGSKAAAPAAAAASERDGASRGRTRTPTKSGAERRSSSVTSHGASPRGGSSHRSTSAISARDASAPRSRSVPRPSTAGAARGALAGAAAAAGSASGASKPFLQRGSGSGGAVARRAPVPNVAFGRSASPPSSIPRKASYEDVAGAAAGGDRSAVSPPRVPGGKARAGPPEAQEQFGSGPATPVDTSPGMRRPVSDSLGTPHGSVVQRHDVRVQRAHGPSSGPAAVSVSSPTTPTDTVAAATGRGHAAGVMSGVEFDDAANMSRSRLTGTPFSQLQLAGATPYDPGDHEMSSIVSRNTTDTPLMAQWNASDAPGAMMAPPVNIVNRPRRVPSLRLLAEMPLQDDVPDGMLPRTMPPPGHTGAHRAPAGTGGQQRPPPMPSVSPAPDMAPGHQGGRAGSFYSVQSGPGSGGGSSGHLQSLVAGGERRGSQASRPYDDEHARRGSDATRDVMAATSMLVAPTPSTGGTPARAPSDSPPSISRGGSASASGSAAPRPRAHDAHVSTPAARAAPQAPVAFSSSAVAAIRDDAHAFPVHHMHSVGSAPSPAAAPSSADDSQMSSPRYSHFRSFRRASATE